jgi:hypothetical protein
MERLIKRQFDRLPEDRKRRAIDVVAPRLAEPPQQRTRRLGDLSRVDIKAPASVVDQVKAITPPANLSLTAQDIAQIVDFSKRWHASQIVAPAGPAPAGTASRVSLRLKQLKCIDDTREAGNDEIYLAGLFIDALGNGRELPVLNLGTFRTGSTVNFTDQELASIRVDVGQFPKTFAAFPLLIEVDRSDEDANLKDNILGILGALLLAFGAIETVLLAMLATPLALVALIIGVIGGVLMILELALRDDYFPADKGIGVSIASNSLTPPEGAQQTLRYEGFGGVYDLTLAFEPQP